MGFLSGVGYAGDSLDPPLDADGVEARLDIYCRTHPLQLLVEAAKALLQDHPADLT